MATGKWWKAAGLVWLLYQAVAPAAACELTFAYLSQASLPFVAGTAPDQPLPGLALEIVSAAAAAHGCKAVFVRRPGKRVVSEAAASFHSGALMLSHTPERARALRYPMAGGQVDQARRLARMNYYLYRKIGNRIEWDGARLQHADGAIGANLGYSVVGDLAALGARVEEVPGTLQNLDKLRMGRLAAYAMHEDGVDALLRRSAYATLEKMPALLAARDYYLVFSPAFHARQQALAEKIWSSIGELRDAMLVQRRAAYDALAPTP